MSEIKRAFNPTDFLKPRGKSALKFEDYVIERVNRARQFLPEVCYMNYKKNYLNDDDFDKKLLIGYLFWETTLTQIELDHFRKPVLSEAQIKEQPVDDLIIENSQNQDAIEYNARDLMNVVIVGNAKRMLLPCYNL